MIEIERSTIPEEAILECSAPGRAADLWVLKWQNRLEFAVNRKKAIKGLLEYGAWSEEELEARSDDELSRIVLWAACCYFREDPDETYYVLEG